MRCTRVICFAVSLVIFGAPSVEADVESTLYGGYEYALYEISPDDGSQSLVGQYETRLTGLTWNSDDGFLYGGNNNNFHRIDRFTGELTTITLGGAYLFKGLAFNPNDGYVYAGGDGVLFRLDPSDGIQYLVAYTGLRLDSLAFNRDDGYLYGGFNNNLFRVDPADGSSVTITSALGGAYNPIIDGLAYNWSDGFLYGGNNNNLYKFRCDGSEFEPISSGGANDLSGVAYVPEPTASGLMLAGAALIGRWRTRRW